MEMTRNIEECLYISRFKSPQTETDIGQMLVEFQDRNMKWGISGFLMTNGSVVMQMIEGEKPELRRLVSNLAVDDRHEDFTVLVTDQKETRSFPAWTMRYEPPENYDVLFADFSDTLIQESAASKIAAMLFDASFVPV